MTNKKLIGMCKEYEKLTAEIKDKELKQKQIQAELKKELERKKVDEMEFVAESSLVKITMKGTREVVNVEIKNDGTFTADDLEMLEDMIMVAVNDANKKVDKALEEHVGKYTKGMPGLF